MIAVRRGYLDGIDGAQALALCKEGHGPAPMSSGRWCRLKH